MPKIHSLFGDKVKTVDKKSKSNEKNTTKTVIENTPIEKPKRGRPKKTIESDINTQKPIKTKITKTPIPKQTKHTATNKQKLKTTINNIKWIRTIDKQPEEFLPIMINTECKKQAFGYKLPNGDYIVDTPYFIDKFKMKNGYLEWQYVKCGNTLSFCEGGFPRCLSCKSFKQEGD